jgi:hypothetical protein
MHAEADIREDTVDPGDILLAASSTCAVLISAPPHDALEIARAIATERGCIDRLLVQDFGSAEASGFLEPRQSPLLLLLREVHDLTPRQQALLMELLEERHGTPPRIIASSSVSLYERVKEGTFDARLYYRLNTVHVIAATNRRVNDADDLNAVM